MMDTLEARHRENKRHPLYDYAVLACSFLLLLAAMVSTLSGRSNASFVNPVARFLSSISFLVSLYVPQSVLSLLGMNFRRQVMARYAALSVGVCGFGLAVGMTSIFDRAGQVNWLIVGLPTSYILIVLSTIMFAGSKRSRESQSESAKLH